VGRLAGRVRRGAGRLSPTVSTTRLTRHHAARTATTRGPVRRPGPSSLLCWMRQLP
jgi:hypothetical protein